MKDYQHILLALDIDETQCAPLIERAQEVIAETKAKLSIMYSCAHLTQFSNDSLRAMALLNDMQDELYLEAKERLASLCCSYHLPKDTQLIIGHGTPTYSIVREAKQIESDLIIMGAHQHKHGVKKLLSHTANSVLEHAHCDVLLVKLEEKETVSLLH